MFANEQSRVYEYDKDFKLVQCRLLKEANSFLHDFVVTDNYYVFFSVSYLTAYRVGVERARVTGACSFPAASIACCLCFVSPSETAWLLCSVKYPPLRHEVLWGTGVGPCLQTPNTVPFQRTLNTPKVYDRIGLPLHKPHLFLPLSVFSCLRGP